MGVKRLRKIRDNLLHNRLRDFDFHAVIVHRRRWGREGVHDKRR